MTGILILSLATGLLASREVLIYWREPGDLRRRGGGCLLLALGWIPLLAWIANRLWPHD